MSLALVFLTLLFGVPVAGILPSPTGTLVFAASAGAAPAALGVMYLYGRERAVRQSGSRE